MVLEVSQADFAHKKLSCSNQKVLDVRSVTPPTQWVPRKGYYTNLMEQLNIPDL